MERPGTRSELFKKNLVVSDKFKPTSDKKTPLSIFKKTNIKW